MAHAIFNIKSFALLRRPLLDNRFAILFLGLLQQVANFLPNLFSFIRTSLYLIYDPAYDRVYLTSLPTVFVMF